MSDDRQVVCNIISEMLDNPNECGIYPTTKAYDDLVDYIEGERYVACGWSHAECCWMLDNDRDPRKEDMSEWIPRIQKDLM